MRSEFTAIVKQDGEWWIGWIEELTGVNCQEHTRDELMESLRVTPGAIRVAYSRMACVTTNTQG